MPAEPKKSNREFQRDEFARVRRAADEGRRTGREQRRSTEKVPGISRPALRRAGDR